MTRSRSNFRLGLYARLSSFIETSGGPVALATMAFRSRGAVTSIHFKVILFEGAIVS